MADIVIRKKIELGFLGEEYKESFLVFRCIAINDYSDLMKRVETVEGDNEKSLKEVISILQDYFIEGIFDKQKVDKEDLGQFDQETLMKSFQALTGQIADPKD